MKIGVLTQESLWKTINMKVIMNKGDENGSEGLTLIRIDPHDTWSLDHTLAQIIVPCLKQFKDKLNGYPVIDNSVSGLEAFENWKSILDKMIYSFEFICSEDFYNSDISPDKVQEGLDLFGKHYMHLWD